MYARTRNTTEETNLSVSSPGRQNIGNGSCFNTNNVPQTVTSVKRKTSTIYDSPIKNYVGRVANGEILPVNPCLNIKKVQVYDLLFTTKGVNVNPCVCGGQSTTNIHTNAYKWALPTVAHIGSVVNEVRGQQAQLIKTAQGDAINGNFDILTLYGERKETIGHIAGRLRDVAALTRGFKQKLKSMRKKESIHGAWLEYRYAIMPNVYAIQDAVKTLTSDSYTRNKGFSRLTKSAVTDTLTTKTWTYGKPGLALREIKKTTITATAVCMAQASILSPTFDFKINPLVTAWELTRLSFVLDWFIDVGDTLASYEAPWTADVVSRSISYKTVTEVIYQVILQNTWFDSGNRVCGIPVGWTLELLQAPKEYVCTLEEYERWPLTAADVARLPRVDVNLNLKRIIDAVALFRAFTR